MTKERAERRARGAEDRRRAQMHLGQLRWLEGFPEPGAGDDGAVRWWALDEAGPSGLDGARLARARRSVYTLRREHAAVLAELVGDAERWATAVGAALALVGDVVHRGATPDQALALATPRVARAARELAAAAPALAELIDAAAIAWCGRPEALDGALAWMRPRTDALAALLCHMPGPAGWHRLLALSRLAMTDADGAAGIDALIALVLVDAPDPIGADAYATSLASRICHSGKPPVAGPATTAPVVIAWIDPLLAREPAERRRALALLVQVDLAGALTPWRTWWRRHGPRLERAEAFAARGIDGGPPLGHVARVLGGVEAARRVQPPAFALAEVLREIGVLAAATLERFHRALARLLTALPAAHGSPVARARLLGHAGRVAVFADDDLRASWLWEAVATALAAGASPRVLGPWDRVWAGERHHWLEDDLLGAARSPADVQRFVAMLARAAAGGAVSRDLAYHLAALVTIDVTPDDAATIARALVGLAEDVRLEPPLVRAAWALADHDPAGLVDVLRQVLGAAGALARRDALGLEAILEHAATGGGAWVIRGALAGGHTRALVDAGEVGALVPRRRWPPLVTAPTDARWIAHYPPPLAAALTRLAAVDPDAEDTARRRLAADLPDPAALAQEAAALRAREPLDARAAARLRTLEARLATPPVPSPVRLARLAAKLDAGAVAIGLARFSAALTAAAQARVVAALRLDRWPDWAPARQGWSVLLALVRLDPPDRALAGRLLAARAGPPPWDLRDEPANRGFLDRLRGRGVDPTAWLDDTARTVEAAGGGRLELAFTSDPVEVFAMGAHFDTCLSPRGSNFFSVIANAVDVNKRVLYARRHGEVVGRCLLALTDAGGILTFHPYAHDRALGFDGLVRELALELAARMGTAVVPRGTVTTLVARDWYDDGPRDLVGRFAGLRAPGLAAELEAIEPAALPARLEAALGHPLDELTLPLVVTMPELTRRPALIVPLASVLLAQRTLPDAIAFEAAGLALAAGDEALADRLIGERAARIDLRSHPWRLGALLARTRPSVALARLRATRPRGVRGWADESGERIAIAGVAMETLRRPRQAAELYRLAVGAESYLEDELRPRLAALGEDLAYPPVR